MYKQNLLWMLSGLVVDILAFSIYVLNCTD
jgi:hypothetical protein